jgi:hypothetical protein
MTATVTFAVGESNVSPRTTAVFNGFFLEKGFSIIRLG